MAAVSVAVALATPSSFTLQLCVCECERMRVRLPHNTCERNRPTSSTLWSQHNTFVNNQNLIKTKSTTRFLCTQNSGAPVWATTDTQSNGTGERRPRIGHRQSQTFLGYVECVCAERHKSALNVRKFFTARNAAGKQRPQRHGTLLSCDDDARACECVCVFV